MASLKDLRDHINSVKATQKITKAMQMVAAAKLRRAQEAVVAARPYSERLREILLRISVNLSENDMPPLMRGTGQDKTHLAVICTSDRGLCGGFNVQIIRRARKFLRARLAEGKQLKILVIGKKGADMLKREFGAYFIDRIDLSQHKTVNFEQARMIAGDIIARYVRGEFDICTLFYSKFWSVMNQEARAQQFIPCRAAVEAQVSEKQQQDLETTGTDSLNIAAEKQREHIFYEYEPDAADVLADLVPRNLAAQIFQVLLENVAGEMGAKMTAMDNATRNAGDLINTLSVSYNRRRQARITTELIEIIAGAEAL